jgi:hypothetical protein
MLEIVYGVIEDTNDPLKNGRVRARFFGVHVDSATELPTSDLPWASVIQSTSSAALSGIGTSPRLLRGSWIVGFFTDTDKQKPIIIGSISGIPGAIANRSPTDVNSISDIVANTPSTTPPIYSSTGIEPQYIGSLTNSQVTTLKTAIAKLTTVQDSSIESSLKSNYTLMANAGVLSPDVVPEKTAGILFVAHMMNVSNAIKYVNGDNIPDASGTTPSQYYQKGYQVILGTSTVEEPTRQNLTRPAIDKNSSQQFQDARKYDPGVSVTTSHRQGFQDPTGTYPLKNHLNESDINRLAKGTNTSKTIVGQKETDRVKSVPVANGTATWAQSPIPYGTVYPNNQVTATEAGHVFELDDTPGATRINLHHQAGTFFEIDDTGNKVEKIVGIRTIIVEKDELVYIKGSGHVNLDGDLSVRVGGMCNIEVIGDANLKVNGNLTQEVTGNYSLKVGGDISMKGSNTNIDGSAGLIITSPNLLLKSPTIMTNPQTGDIMNGLHMPTYVPITVTPISTYAPSIQIPTPISRQEAVDFILEDSPDITSVLYQNAPAPLLKKSDTTPPLTVISVSGLCGFTQLSGNTQLTVNYQLSDLYGNHPFPFVEGQHGLMAEEIACNMKQLAINVLEPLREKYSSIGFKINSAFREAGSNISKSKNISQHELGQAVDISFTTIRGKADDREQFYNLANEIKNIVPFDQLLLEYRSTGSVWIHISFTSQNLRRQVLTLNDDKTYGEGLHLLM